MVPHARRAPLSLNSGPILLGEVAETARGNQQDHVKYASYLAVVKAQLIMHLAPKSCSAQLLHLSAFFLSRRCSRFQTCASWTHRWWDFATFKTPSSSPALAIIRWNKPDKPLALTFRLLVVDLAAAWQTNSCRCQSSLCETGCVRRHWSPLDEPG